jgi:hypothetical protein
VPIEVLFPYVRTKAMAASVIFINKHTYDSFINYVQTRPLTTHEFMYMSTTGRGVILDKITLWHGLVVRTQSLPISSRITKQHYTISVSDHIWGSDPIKITFNAGHTYINAWFVHCYDNISVDGRWSLPLLDLTNCKCARSHVCMSCVSALISNLYTNTMTITVSTDPLYFRVIISENNIIWCDNPKNRIAAHSYINKIVLPRRLI